MKSLILIAVFSLCWLRQDVAQTSKSDADDDPKSSVVNLYKDQLAALDVAMREMRKSGRSFRGQQVRIEDHGSSVSIGFMEDPIDEGIVGGSQNAITWEIRKSDSKVTRWSLAK